ncbi:MAG TPA: hypothetical protein VLX68_00075 [Chitinivibrionales bacterium]|nr:hypothetical protein [Chitinivibrionales bacterium]
MLHQIQNVFVSRVKTLETTRCKIEFLFSKKDIVLRDVNQCYHGLFLSLVVAFESYLEDAFFHIISSKSRKVKKLFKPVASFSTNNIARKIVHADKKYLDWLPYDKLKDRFDIYLECNCIFDKLDQHETTALKQISIIRNSLSHCSAYSKKQFIDKVIGNNRVLPIEKTPTGYLRSIYRSSPRETRYQLYSNYLVSISNKLIS